MASYELNERAVARARDLISKRQYLLESDWGDVQPKAEDENAFLDAHTCDEYAAWHLGLTQGATDETNGRYGFVYGASGGSTAWGSSPASTAPPNGGHKTIELAAHDLLQYLDSTRA
jgi:hypothetical protein